jgi:hypothetical protein
MSGVECPRSDCIVPFGVPTTSSMVAWLCLRSCHVTPGSPNLFAMGFRCLRKRFHRSNGNPSRVANTRAFVSAAKRAILRQADFHLHRGGAPSSFLESIHRVLTCMKVRVLSATAPRCFPCSIADLAGLFGPLPRDSLALGDKGHAYRINGPRSRPQGPLVWPHTPSLLCPPKLVQDHVATL